MTTRKPERKEDIDILVFKNPAEEDIQREEFETSQRALIFPVSNPNDRYSTPTMLQN
jgi:hypothetical protein